MVSKTVMLMIPRTLDLYWRPPIIQLVVKSILHAIEGRLMGLRSFRGVVDERIIFGREAWSMILHRQASFLKVLNFRV